VVSESEREVICQGFTKSAFTAALLFSSTSNAFDRVGRVYEIGKLTGAPIYTQKTHAETSPSGETMQTSEITDPNGKLVMTEHAVFSGTRIVSQKTEQLQDAKSYELKMDGKRWLFQTFDIKDGKPANLISSKSEEAQIDFTSGPAAEALLKEKWDELNSGKTIKVHFAVLELNESVGFQFAKSGTETVNGMQAVVIKMKPTSFFIGLLVAPIEMVFDANAKNLVRYRGRTPLKKLVDGSWKPLDAEIIYDSK
jgi:hypothetical protein